MKTIDADNAPIPGSEALMNSLGPRLGEIMESAFGPRAKWVFIAAIPAPDDDEDGTHFAACFNGSVEIARDITTTWAETVPAEKAEKIEVPNA